MKKIQKGDKLKEERGKEKNLPRRGGVNFFILLKY
jgi:hypothetical protein